MIPRPGLRGGSEKPVDLKPPPKWDHHATHIYKKTHDFSHITIQIDAIPSLKNSKSRPVPNLNYPIRRGGKLKKKNIISISQITINGQLCSRVFG